LYRILLLATTLLLTASTGVGCIHSNVTRVGRMPLGGGHEGLAPVLEKLSPDQEKAAVISVNSSKFGTTQRPIMHLRRRASLLGCDGIYNLHRTATRAFGTCIRNRAERDTPTIAMVVRTPSHDLVERASNDRVYGLALIKILNRISNLPANKRAWQLQWYLETYPESPYTDDVEGLFIASADFGKAKGHASLRAAPLSR